MRANCANARPTRRVGRRLMIACSPLRGSRHRRHAHGRIRTISVHCRSASWPSRLLTFAFWFGVVAFRHIPAGEAGMEDAILFAFATAAGVIFLRYGPGRTWRHTDSLQAPYAWLIPPGFDSVRAARFGLLMMLRLPRRRHWPTRESSPPHRARRLSLARGAGEGWIVLPAVPLPPSSVPPRILAATRRS